MIRFLLSVILFSVSNVVFPQITLSSLYESYYDDNIFNNSSNVSDFINNLSLGAGYNIESGNNNVQLYYMNNISYYQSNIYKSSNTHKAGIVDTYLFSEDENPLNIGVNYSLKKNRDYFTLFDFNMFSFYSNYFHKLSENSRILGGYLFIRNRFDNYPMFSHDENKIFMKFTESFQTKTTFILGVEYDYKNYLSSAEEFSGSQKIIQMKYYLHAAQSLGERTGISAHFLLRKNLNSGTRFITSGDLIYYEEEMFLDNYSNDGYEAGFGVSHIFSSVFKGVFDATYQTNNYLNLPVVDENGFETNSFRSDKRFMASIELNAELSSIINGLYGSLSMSIIGNTSNDLFYKYSNNIYSIGFGWEF